MSFTQMIKTPSLGVVLFISATFYLLGLVVYRAFLHPLANYPGPLLAKITNMYMAYHAVKGDCHLEFWRCHEKYGNIVRFGPNSLSFNSCTALKDIYWPKVSIRKSAFYSAFWATGTHDTASTHSSIDKTIHSRKRRVLSQGFSDGAMKSVEKYILSHIRNFCDTVTKSMPTDSGDFGESLDISSQSNYLTFDVMGDLCFGKSFDMLDRADNHFAIDLIANATHRHYICGMYPKLHQYRLDRVFLHKIATGRARYLQYSEAQATSRTKSESDRKDFFYHLLNAKDPETGEGFSKTELWSESNSLIIAGSDTTSTGLSATLFYLLHNKTCLEKLANEIRPAFSEVENIQIGQPLSNLRYLRACIDEALRMSPPVGGLLPRETIADTMVDGKRIPSRTIIGVPHYTLHHNPTYFPDPFDFRPERWLTTQGGTNPESVAAARSAFCPFSVGPRSCIGKGNGVNIDIFVFVEQIIDHTSGMAYHEMTLALARILYLFDLRLAPGYETIGEGKPEAEYGRHRPSEYQLKDIFTSIKEGPIVQFRARI